MAIDFVKLDERHEEAYEELLMLCPWAMIYHTLKYRSFLKNFLQPYANDHYILAFDNNILVGAIPAFITTGSLGPILNSLPFFGSNGSILLRPNSDRSTSASLARALECLCQEKKITSATIVDTPFVSFENEFQNSFKFDYSDKRVGQVTILPSGTNLEEVGERLLRLFHQKTRNIVRKSLRNDFNFEFSYNQSASTLDELFILHEKNILGIGGIPKPKLFFETIAKHFEPDEDYRVYTARTKSGDLVCGLLLLYFKDTVEYFVPATAECWRSAQPLSALIYLSMCDAIVERNAKKWNWGGTWLSQDGVYHFKSRWGTTDFPYEYFTRVRLESDALSGLSPKKLQKHYPWFYTIPYSSLPNSTHE